MAELIDKSTMLDWVQKQVEAVTKKQVAGSDGIFTREVLTTMQRDLSAFENEINAMPTTTEAEIRAKAYKKFAESVILELECFAREMYGEPNSGFIDMCIDIVNTVAEQLKERE